MIIEGQLSIYLHWPFCLSKCPYCDFNVHVRDDIDFARWEAAYLKTLSTYREMLGERIVHSLYFGGGTPSTMPPEMVGRIIDHTRSLWPVSNAPEITLEANPTSIEATKFEGFKEAGVNRVSIGVQALNDSDLKFLGRQHNRDEALEALKIASDLFERFSFDLIYARPEQSLKAWEAELEEACSLAKGHLSMYQLTVERNTPFYFDHSQKKFALPSEELAADFYILTDELTRRHGIESYEVSNYAAGEEHFSRHNLQYWRSGEYIGVGPGAHGRMALNGERHETRDHFAPDKWLEWVEGKGHGAHPFQVLSQESLAMEIVMMGLRLKDGLAFESVERLSGLPWQRVLDVSKLQTLADQGWLEMNDQHMRLTLEGMLRLNALLPFILIDQEKMSSVA